MVSRDLYMLALILFSEDKLFMDLMHLQRRGPLEGHTTAFQSGAAAYFVCCINCRNNKFKIFILFCNLPSSFKVVVSLRMLAACLQPKMEIALKRYNFLSCQLLALIVTLYLLIKLELVVYSFHSSFTLHECMQCQYYCQLYCRNGEGSRF